MPESSDEEKFQELIFELAELIDLAARLVDRAGSLRGYLADPLLQVAAAGILIRLREAVNRLSEEFKVAHPDVPWKEIVATGNVVAHNYGSVDHELVWDALTRGFPHIRVIFKDHLISLDHDEQAPPISARPTVRRGVPDAPLDPGHDRP